MPVTLRFQSTGPVPGGARPAVTRGGSLTAGRGPDNDLVLPDPDRVVSSRHFAVEEREDGPVVVDLSTNGTFLNYAKTPLGPAPAPLRNGDILCAGDYELLVEVCAEAPRAPAAAPEPEALGEPDPLDLPGGEGERDFLDDLLGDAPPRGPASVERPELGEDGLMPPLGGDDPPAPPLRNEGPMPSFGGDDPAPPPPADGATPPPRGGDPVPPLRADGSLPPLRGEDAGRDPWRDGASRPQHAPATRDHFAPPPARPVIPEGWDDLLAAPPSGGGDPFAAPEPAAAEPVPGPGDPPEAPGPGAAEPADPASPGSWGSVPPPPHPGPAHLDAPPGPGPGEEAAARAFLEAVGVGRDHVPDAELAETFARLGTVMRVVIEGLREVLMTRAEIKSEMRVRGTVVGAGGNNPLKFSVSPEQAVEAMIRPGTAGYLEAAEAAREAMRDVRAHEVAVMTGMEAALRGLLRDLSPDALEGRASGGLFSSRKARAWDVYRERYAEISEAAAEDFHEVFGREFARAYQAQLDRLGR